MVTLIVANVESQEFIPSLKHCKTFSQSLSVNCSACLRHPSLMNSLLFVSLFAFRSSSEKTKEASFRFQCQVGG